jgi:protein-disulfide isomerase
MWIITRSLCRKTLTKAAPGWDFSLGFSQGFLVQTYCIKALCQDFREERIVDKKSGGVFIIVIAVLLVVLAGAYFFAMKPQTPVVDETAITEEATPVTDETAIKETAPANPIELTAVGIDLNTVLKERILGNPSAPTKIAEFASFSCSHCGDFHRQVFDQVKTAYIDSGKAYLVFSDFPLNAPALHASMIARCLPEDRFFDFAHMLFTEQEAWVQSGDYLSFFKGKAIEQGMTEDQFKACLQSKEIQQGIVDRMKAAQAQWNISSTPTFIVNNTHTIPGAISFEAFATEVEKATGLKVEAPAPAPEQTVPSDIAPAEVIEEPATPETTDGSAQ